MPMYSFANDYSEGCHPRIIQALAEIAPDQHAAYGNDAQSNRAKALIQTHCNAPDLPIYFVSGGTMANLLVIASALRAHESVLSVDTGHIVGHEAAAIEATGHKVICAPATNGKLTPAALSTALTANTAVPHNPRLRMVYISNATETGTAYTLAELTALSDLCRAHDLFLFMDGARLGSALMSDACDLTLPDIARLTDAFWIGGTKNGALLGEAIAFPNAELARDFPIHLKQRGGMMAKSFLTGTQFACLFENGLYFSLARHANAMACKLGEGIVTAGYELTAPATTNQIFPILPNAIIERLAANFAFHVWQETDDDHAVIRLVTSWATHEHMVDAFLAELAG